MPKPKKIIDQNLRLRGCTCTSPAGLTLFGLRVLDGARLLLVGGDVQIDGGETPAGLIAQSGRIELGGLAQTDAIALDDNFRLAYPSDVARSNVSLLNNARVRILSKINTDYNRDRIDSNCDRLAAYILLNRIS